jgi:NAD(P)-dependent dehydrogenase (short-subunit alcohol dehydrogenase family)
MVNDFVLVTGGKGDIGKSVVNKILHMSDLHVLVTTTMKEKVLSFDSGRVEEIEMDASAPASIEAAIKKLSDYPISYFIQLHGHSKIDDQLIGQTGDSLAYHFNINVFSTVLILEKILIGMQARNFGRVVLMNTASSEHGGGLTSFGYGMAKHSVGFLTKHMAKYFAQDNILTNCISPGLIDTKFHTDVMQRTPEEIKERSKTVRLRKAGTTDDVAGLIYYLVFENDFVTGQNIKIDGGDFI